MVVCIRASLSLIFKATSAVLVIRGRGHGILLHSLVVRSAAGEQSHTRSVPHLWDLTTDEACIQYTGKPQSGSIPAQFPRSCAIYRRSVRSPRIITQ